MMTKYKVAVISVFSPEVLRVIEGCAPEEFELVISKGSDEQAVIEVAAGADFFLAGAIPLTGAIMDSAPNLRLIQKWGSGVDKIDLAAAAERNIPVANTAGANSTPVAELTIALMLAVYRHIPYADQQLRQGIWAKPQVRGISHQLSGKTAGIVGFGHIGQKVARLARAFDAKVIYYKRSRVAPELEAEIGAEYRPLDDLLPQADIVSLHVPLTPETQGMIDRRVLSMMRPTSVLINTSRGAVVDESALAEALGTGKIMAAGLDTFTTEPPEAANPLLKMRNVVVTPHLGSSVIENMPSMANHCFDNMLRVVRGEPLPEADVIRA